MSISGILVAVAVVGGVGLFIGVFLGLAAIKFKVADVTSCHMAVLQQQLLEDGCFIPGMNRPLSGNVTFDLPDEKVTVLGNGWDRPHDGAANTVMIPDGQALTIHFKTPVSMLRVALDPDFSRDSISCHGKY